MGRIVFRLTLAGFAVYFYAQGNVSWAALCVLVIADAFLRQPLVRLARVLRRLPSLSQEYDANIVLIYTVRLSLVFEHPAVNDLFARLHKDHKGSAQTLEEWRKLLADSYARKYKRDDSVCEVRFNIKNNLLFVNGVPDFRDHVYYELEIPYRWTETGEPQEASWITPSIESQLAVRILLLNGMLLLQVGEFNKEHSPNILRGGGLAVYETYATVTSFPIMYFAYQHGIPVRYLNLLAAATPSYKASYDERRSATIKKPAMYRDWQALHHEVAGYRALCDSGDAKFEMGLEKLGKLEKAFEEKREKLLAAEGYQTYQAHDDDSHHPDTGHSYWNRYCTVFFHNLNANRDSLGPWFLDYYGRAIRRRSPCLLYSSTRPTGKGGPHVGSRSRSCPALATGLNSAISIFGSRRSSTQRKA